MADVANYVKFNRGSLAAYQNAIKNSDTLYFIHNDDETKYSIFLGEKPVASGVSNISEIEDILLTELGDKQLLVYDETSGKWVNKSVKNAIGDFVGASAEAQGQSGLVPAPGIGDQNKFLRGDGSWAEINVEAGSTTKVYETSPVDEESHIEALTRIVNGATLNSGDIGIIKVLIAGEKYEYTAYVYDGENWKAMDGNYSAENVYFNSDFTFTEQVGTVTIPSSGSATVTATGKSVKEFLASLFAAPKNPTVTNPSVSITLTGSGEKEVGSTITPSYSATFNKGKYSYGPDTGITATYEVSNNNDDTVKDTLTGSFDAITIGDNTSYSVTIKATYTDGATPVNNLGTEMPDLAIKAGSKSATSSGKYTGYRASFYGTLDEKETEIDSALIRSKLTASTGAFTNGKEFSINIPVGAMRIVFAYPATLQDVTSVKDVNGMNAEIVGVFNKTIVSVEGANGYEGIDYKVYTYVRSSATTEANSYAVTI